MQMMLEGYPVKTGGALVGRPGRREGTLLSVVLHCNQRTLVTILSQS